MADNTTRNKDAGFVVNKLLKDHKEIAAILSKFQKDSNDSENNGKTDENKIAMDYPTLKTHSEKNNEKTKTNDDIMALFPDSVIAREILVGSIVTPNSFKEIAINYKAPGDFPMLDVVKKGVCNIIKEHINKYYKLEYNLKDIVREALFEKGSYVECFIPEASLDDAINNYKEGNESIKPALKDSNYTDIIKSLKPGLESSIVNIETNEYRKYSYLDSTNSKKTNANVEGIRMGDKVLPLPVITDNPKLLRNVKKDIKEASGKLRAGNLGYLSIDQEGNVTMTKKSKDDLESRTKEEDSILDFLDIFSKDPEMVNKKNNNSDEDTSLLVIKNRTDASRKSIGRPLVLSVPTEGVIPIHSPYDKSDHIGYFILLDENGKLLDMSGSDDSYLQDPDSSTPVQVGTVDHNSFITQGRRNTEAMTKEVDSMSINEELFADIVHGMVAKKLKEGAFADLALFNKQDNQLIYKLMFFRALKNRGTQMLFLPADQVVYYAYEYRKDGTGRSLLEKNSFIYSLRAILLMATINASLTNAQNIQEVTVDLGENVSNVEEVVSQIQEALISNREMTFPIGTVSPLTLQTILARSGYKFNINSPRLPQVSISSSDTARSVTVPDEALDEKLKSMQLLAMGITPEMVKQGEDVDFATIATSRQLLFDNRISLLRQRTDELNSEYVRKVLKNDEELRTKIERYLISNFKTISVYLAKNINKMDETNDSMTVSQQAFILYVNKAMQSLEEGIEVKLPKSELEDGGPIMKNMNTVFQNIDSTVDALFTSDVLSTEFLGDTIGNKATLMTAMLKTALKRKWVVENNAVPDLIDLMKPITPESDETDNAFTSMIEDIESIVKQFSVAYNIRKKLGEESEVLKKIDDEGNPGYEDSWGAGSGGSSWDSGDSGGGDSGGDEGGEGDDSGDDGSGGGDDDWGSDDMGGGDEGGDDDTGEDDDQSLDEGDEDDDSSGSDDDDNPTKGTDDEIEGWV